MNDIRKAMQDILRFVEVGIEASVPSACEVVLESIFEERSWVDDTYNLRDSYAWAFYKRGNEIGRGYLEDVPMASEPRKVSGRVASSYGEKEVYGRDQVDAFLESFEPSGDSEYTIVFVAGMYYAVFLQDHFNILMGFISGEQVAKEEVIKALRNTSWIAY